jgi:hypothetical protein
MLTPALSPFWGVPVRSHACPEDAVYSLNDSCSYFTNVFSLRVLLTYVERISYYNTCMAHIHIRHHIHMYIYTYTIHHIHMYACIFISSFLHRRLAALNSLCPIQLASFRNWLVITLTAAAKLIEKSANIFVEAVSKLNF